MVGQRRLLVAAMAAAAAVLSAPAAGAQAQTAKRVALIIGNSRYGANPSLANPVNDARSLRDILTRAGFKVTELEDRDKDQMLVDLHHFQLDVLHADVAVFYFAGHGLQMDGANYLLPVDASLSSDADVAVQTIAQDAILQAASGAAKMNLVIFDSCRKNPFAASMKSTGAHRGISLGLAPVNLDVYADTYVVYAAKDGQEALDGADGHSPFAKALIKHIAEPGVEIKQILGEIHDDVWNDTKVQVPKTYGEWGAASRYIVPPATAARPVFYGNAPRPRRLTQPTVSYGSAPDPAANAPPPPTSRGPVRRSTAPTSDPVMVDHTDWSQALEAYDAPHFDQYLKDHPGGDFVSLAKRKLAALAAAGPAGVDPGVEALAKARLALQVGDVVAAAKWYRVAAELDVAPAQVRVGGFYASGGDGKPDYDEAIAWYQKAADQGSAPAAYRIGTLYYSGQGRPVDYDQAMVWFRRAAQGGSAAAMNELGIMYGVGKGVPVDPVQSFHWYLTSAQHGENAARYNVGNRYLRGSGVEQDYDQAIYWLSKAADAKDRNAQYALGMIYAQGKAAPRDLIKARDWMLKAAALNHPAAGTWLSNNPPETTSAG